MRWRSGTDEAVQALRDENARLFTELSGVQRRFQHIARRLWQVQEDERRRIARELHDQLGQVLTALVHRLERPDAAREESIALARQALADVRELSRLLRPPVLDELGIAAALRWLARRTREDTGIVVDAVADDVARSPEVETLVFRIAQEAVTNAVKHARPTRISMRLARIGDTVELRVRDDGAGFDADATEWGSGLIGIRDRVTLYDGTFALASAPGRGTTLTIGVRLAGAAG